MMIIRFCLMLISSVSFFILSLEARKVDPYKVLGVERNADKRQIQKAFHKLSLQYHPDKNKNKGAQDKFAEINNAYEILYDEEKRKTYDLYADETRGHWFSAGNPRKHTDRTNRDSRFTHRRGPDEWGRAGSNGNSKRFTFSFSSHGNGEVSFSFDFDDIYSILFGGETTKRWNLFSSWVRSQFGSRTPPLHRIQSVNSTTFKRDIMDKGVTWLLLSYTPTSTGNYELESIVEEVGRSLSRDLKVGSINCHDEKSLCKELGLSPTVKARLFIYSYKTGDEGSAEEYNGVWEAKSLKSFCEYHLLSSSRRVNLGSFDFSSSTGNLPHVLLISTKRNKIVIWNALSGLYQKRIIFFDAEVSSASDPTLNMLGVDALPAIVGWLPDGEKHVLKTGITVKNLKSAVDELSALLDNFEKRNKKANSGQSGKAQENEGTQLPLVSSLNWETVCGDTTTMCIIGVFRSSKGRGKLESILSIVSHMSLTRQQNQSGTSVSYSLLDANKHTMFLNSFDKCGFESADELLLAYKPRTGKFAALTEETTMEEVEKFVGSVLNGDVLFSTTQQKPALM